MTGPGDLAALDVCVRFSMEFRFALDKRGEGGKKESIFVPKRRKMNRGIWRHKSVSDRLKGWNRERADTLARLKGGRTVSGRRALDAQTQRREITRR